MHRHQSSFETDAEADLVFDFSGMDSPDMGGLVIMLTVREMVQATDRRVWVRSLPDSTWRMLGAMGLAGLFELFPNSGERDH